MPDGENVLLHWPTPRRDLFSDPAAYFARTRANPDYGRPGWTRNCGRQFHRGCDIAPLAPRPTGRNTTVMFTDCATDTEYPSEEPVLTCDDEIFAVFDGNVAETTADGFSSPLGMHIIIEHRWPGCGRKFFTLYAHLSALAVLPGDAVRGGQRIGTMGQTSRSPDARNWMAIAPHLHFEALDEDHRPFDPGIFLHTFLPR